MVYESGVFDLNSELKEKQETPLDPTPEGWISKTSILAFRQRWPQVGVALRGFPAPTK
jgi:hypothetical protein